VRIVWTMHNLRPHETAYPALDRLLTWTVAALSNALVVHSRYAGERLAREYPWLRRPTWIAPHGHYMDEYAGGPDDRDTVRAALAIPDEAFLFLTFGQLRRYKRADAVIRAVRSLEADDVHLLVVGAPLDDAVRQEIVHAADGDPRVHLRLKFVPDADVAPLHAAADAAIVAYPEVFSSGALLLALSLGVPVVAPRESAASEAAQPPALSTFEDGALPAALEAIRAVPRAEASRAARAAAERHSWSITARRVRDAYDARAPD
jgi:glycosyltransferase involved in cell wall biosynthesis